MVQLWASKRGTAAWWTRLTSPQQIFRHFLSLLSPAYEPNGNRNALSRQPSIVVFVGDIPYFAEESGREIRTSEGFNSNFTGKNAEFLGVE